LGSSRPGKDCSKPEAEEKKKKKRKLWEKQKQGLKPSWKLKTEPVMQSPSFVPCACREPGPGRREVEVWEQQLNKTRTKKMKKTQKRAEWGADVEKDEI